MNLRFLTAIWLRMPLAILAGAMAPLSLAPFNIWLAGIVSIALFAVSMNSQTGKRCILLAFCYGFGLYGAGASWVYISISEFGSSSSALSALLTVGFVAGLSLCFSLPFYAYGRWFSRSNIGWVIALPAIWVLDEWMRSWLFTGFPWLYLGYAHIDTWLAGWAPVFGVYGVSFFVVFTASLILYLVKLVLLKKGLIQNTLEIKSSDLKRQIIIVTCAILCIWLTGAALKKVSWTELNETPISVGMAQGNIPQDRKWDPLYVIPTFRIFNQLSNDLWQHDWVIWPEAAIPLLYHQAKGDLDSLDAMAKSTNTVFITGILYDDFENQKYYNSVTALGKGSGITFKTRLVPFGEYVPLENMLRGLIDFFDLPTSILHIGPDYERGLQANGVEIASSVCYEVVYPDLMAKRAATANALLTVSNEAWFGSSPEQEQHFQMAQMRALETGRYMIRSTNNGMSGIINNKGQVVTKGGHAIRETIVGDIHVATGKTPFILWQSWPMVFLCFGLLVGARRLLA